MPLERFLYDIVDIPALQIPVIHMPACFKQDRRFLPGIAHLKILNILRIEIGHMRPLIAMKAAHIPKQSTRNPTLALRSFMIRIDSGSCSSA